MPDASQWRSTERYKHIEKLTASDLAWEWLRRNEAYDRDYRQFSKTKEDPQLLTDQIRQRWGLRFPCRSRMRFARCPGFLDAARRHQRRSAEHHIR